MSVPVVVITGASEGIGSAMAREFARRGARLGLIARRKELLESVATELRSLGSPEVRIAAVDVTDSASFRAALASFEKDFGAITHFVANAGITSRSRPTKDSYEELRACFSVNLLAAVDGLEWMKERMVARRSGTLVGVSSVAGTRGLPDSGAYSSSKAGLTTYLESLRVDLFPHGVRVVTIAPGYIDTPLTKKNKGSMPFLMSADLAAPIFVDGVFAGRRFVVAPYPYVWVIRLLRILPAAIYDRVLRRAMRGIRGSTPETR